MPTYDYVCEKCGHTFEFFHSMKDEPLKVCPKELCPGKKWGKGKVQKQLGTGAGLIFKGSGFYITDYRSEGYKTAASKDTAPAAAPTSTPSSSSAPAGSAPAASGGGSSSASAASGSAGGAKPKPKPTK